MSNPETLIQNRGMLHLSAVMPELVLWRNNVGVAEHISPQGKAHTVKYGLADGSADCVGVLRPWGLFVAVEWKTPKGRQSATQKRWGELVARMGGIYVLATSGEEAEERIREELKRMGLTGGARPGLEGWCP